MFLLYCCTVIICGFQQLCSACNAQPVRHKGGLGAMGHAPPWKIFMFERLDIDSDTF